MSAVAILLVLAFCIPEALYTIVVNAETASGPGNKSAWDGRMGLFNAFICIIASILLYSVAIPSILTNGLEVSQKWLLPVVMSGVLFTGIIYFETKSLSYAGEVSRVTPIGATTPALMAIVAMVMHNEYPSIIGWCGIAVVIIGVYCTRIQSAISDSNNMLGKDIGKKYLSDLTLHDWIKPFTLLSASTAVLYAYGTMLFGTLNINVEAEAMRNTNVAFASGCIVTLGAVGNLILYRLQQPQKKIALADLRMLVFRPRVFVVGLCLFLSVWLGNAALTYADVAYIGSFKRLYIPLAMILAYLFLRERRNFKERFVGGSIMTFGAILLSFA